LELLEHVFVDKQHTINQYGNRVSTNCGSLCKELARKPVQIHNPRVKATFTSSIRFRQPSPDRRVRVRARHLLSLHWDRSGLRFSTFVPHFIRTLCLDPAISTKCETKALGPADCPCSNVPFSDLGFCARLPLREQALHQPMQLLHLFHDRTVLGPLAEELEQVAKTVGDHLVSVQPLALR
jgi:hypothetical protein